MMTIKTYSELITLPTFLERYAYLKLSGNVGDTTFGGKRYLNQLLYHNDFWLTARRRAIIRDNGYDLGIYGREIITYITVHHINPITIDDIKNNNPMIFDLENLITTSDITHKAIHYGNVSLLSAEPIVRHPYDTCPWKH